MKKYSFKPEVCQILTNEELWELVKDIYKSSAIDHLCAYFNDEDDYIESLKGIVYATEKHIVVFRDLVAPFFFKNNPKINHVFSENKEWIASR